MQISSTQVDTGKLLTLVRHAKTVFAAQHSISATIHVVFIVGHGRNVVSLLLFVTFYGFSCCDFSSAFSDDIANSYIGKLLIVDFEYKA